jgi:hypothetical protein
MTEREKAARPPDESVPESTDKQEALIEEIKRDPMAFFARTDVIEAEADELKAIAEERRWAQAKWLHDQWNPHNEEPKRGSWRPTDGEMQSELAAKVGVRQATISRWIHAYRRFGWYPGCMTLGEAVTKLTHEDREALGRSRTRSDTRKALREQPEAIAPDIASAMENPEVMEKVLGALTPAARAALMQSPTMPVAQPVTDEPDDDDGGAVRRLAAVPDPKAKDPYAKQGDRALRNKIERGDDADAMDVLDLYTRDAQKAAHVAAEALDALEQRMTVLGSGPMARFSKLGLWSDRLGPSA